ncbi:MULTISPECIES: hypothetical protein [Caldicellulosiruptor]|nr:MULTISPECIES: hypothetical protein [Caldicellulosiruptor]
MGDILLVKSSKQINNPKEGKRRIVTEKSKKGRVGKMIELNNVSERLQKEENEILELINSYEDLPLEVEQRENLGWLIISPGWFIFTK